MKLNKYLFDKWLEILFVLLGYFIVMMMLFAFKVDYQLIIGITVVFICIFIIFLVHN